MKELSSFDVIAEMMFPSLSIEKKGGWAYVSFDSWNEKRRIRRRWDPREGSHFPSWKSHPWGGTRSMLIVVSSRLLRQRRLRPGCRVSS